MSVPVATILKVVVRTVVSPRVTVKDAPTAVGVTEDGEMLQVVGCPEPQLRVTGLL